MVTLERLIEVFELVEVENAYTVMLRTIKRCKTLGELKQWWAKHAATVAGLKQNEKDAVVRLKDQMKGQLK